MTNELNNNVAKVVLTAAPAVLTGDVTVVISTAICEMLKVSLDSFTSISKKRTSELFGDEEIVTRIVCRINESEDFSSLVLDIWRRYNFECSEKRREMLKSILVNATNDGEIHYENFSKLFLITQQITNLELVVLNAFYLPDAYLYASTSKSTNVNFQLAVHELYRLFDDKKLDDFAKSELELSMSQLSYYGLVSQHPTTMGGPYYSPVRFGKIFLEYIKN